MTAVRRATAMRQLDSMFGNMHLDGPVYNTMYTTVIEHDPRCDVHGRNSPHRSLYLYGREHSPAYRKGSVSPIHGPILRRRASLGLTTSPLKDVHPSDFPSSLRRETPSPTSRLNSNRHSMGSHPNLSRGSIHSVNYHRPDSAASGSSIRDMKRDYVGSNNSLSKKNSSDHSKSSVDSLDSWHIWETGRKSSMSSNDPLFEEEFLYKNKVHQNISGKSSSSPGNGVEGRPAFKPVTELEDLQAIRCAEFHPNGKLYAVGANSKILRICAYPKIDEINEFNESTAPSVLFKRTKHHKGSIYCLAWSPAGDLMATGSNDKTVKLMRFNSSACNLEGNEMELTMHDGTVRDICFIEDTTNKSSVLVSGGAGDCTIYVTDCSTGVPFQTLCGHSGHVLSLYNWGGAVFASGSQDKTVRIWDLRTRGCVNIITSTAGSVNKGSPVTSVAVDPSGRLLVSGHENGNCDLHDVRGTRALQRFTPHTSDVRSVRFSPGAYYLLTAGYDGNVVLTDLQGDLTCDLPRVTVAQHPSKVISARWHPDDFSFLSTSADRTAVLWTIPPV